MKSHLILTSTEGMTNRDWLSFRTRGIGASDVPAVLGFSEYESPMSKFDEKISLIPKPKFENLSMFLGKQAEDKNAEMWEYWDGSVEEMIKNFYSGNKVRRCRRINSYVQNPKYKWLFVSLDRVINKHTWKGVEFGEGTLEMKNLSSYEADKWEGGIPLKHLLQVQTQMAVCEFDYGELAVKLDDRNYTVYPFEKGAIIVFELNVNSLNKDDIRTSSNDIYEAFKRTNLFENDKNEPLHSFAGTNIILIKNKIVLIKDNNLSEWTLDKVENDIEKIVKPTES